MGFAAAFAFRLALAAAGTAVSLVLLARLRPVERRPSTPTRLHPLDLFAAAALLLVLRYVGLAVLGPPAGGASPDALLRLAGEVALVLLFLRWRSGPVGFFPRGPADARRRGAGWAIAVYVAALPGLLGVVWLNLLLVERFTGRPPVDEILHGFAALAPLEQVLTAALAVLLMPLLEEMLFRGFLFRTLAARRDYGAVRALFFSSLVFALAHGSAMWLPAFVLGSMLAWTDLHSGDLRRAVLIHVAHNTAVLVLTSRSVPLA